jgi:hypothetical protein
MQAQKRYSLTDCYRNLMAAVTSRALADLGRDICAIKTSPAAKDEAMTWINGPDCEAYCLALDVDYAVLRERATVLYRLFLESEDVPKRRLNRTG